MQVGRGVALVILTGFNGRFNLDTMFLFRVLTDVSPFAQPLARTDRFLAEVGVSKHCIQPHAHGKLVIGITAWAQGRAYLAVHHPFKMRYAIRLLVSQDPQDSFLRAQFRHYWFLQVSRRSAISSKIRSASYASASRRSEDPDRTHRVMRPARFAPRMSVSARS